MAAIYSFRVGVLPTSAADVTGFDVQATDGDIGKIDEANDETAASCLVVDTGFWIFGKKRLIPAGVVTSVDTNDRKVYVAMTKDQIKNAPDYDPERHRQDKQRYYDDLGGYYSPYTS